MSCNMNKGKKVCLVTGGTSGIGLETAKRFLKNNYRVVIAGNDREEVIQSAVKELEPLGEMLLLPTDISGEDQCRNVVDKTAEAYGRLDVLANVAGITEKHLFTEGAFDEVRRVLEVNLFGTLSMCKYGARQMAKQGGGVIINVSSMCSVKVNDATVAYHSSKAGVTRATQVIAKEMGEQNIRCVSVAPAWVNTRLVLPGTAEAGGRLHIRRKIIEPGEVAAVIYFLAQDEAAAVNGSQVMVDDGYCEFKVID